MFRSINQSIHQHLTLWDLPMLCDRQITFTKRIGLSSRSLCMLLCVHTPKLQMADFDHVVTEGCDLPNNLPSMVSILKKNPTPKILLFHFSFSIKPQADSNIVFSWVCGLLFHSQVQLHIPLWIYFCVIWTHVSSVICFGSLNLTVSDEGKWQNNCQISITCYFLSY